MLNLPKISGAVCHTEPDEPPRKSFINFQKIVPKTYKTEKWLSSMEKMHQILKKSPRMRSVEEVAFLVKIIGNIKFFKESQELTENHFLEICKNLEVKHYNIGENAITFDEIGEHFYVILKGSVAVNVANPVIKSWREKHREYLKLK